MSSSCSLRNPLFKNLTSSSLLRPLISPFHFFSSFSSFPATNQRAREARILTRLLSGIPTTSSASWNDVSTAPYVSVRIRCRKDVADTLSEALLCFGASSASMDEPDNFEGADEICINSIFAELRDAGTCISHAADSIGLKEIPTYEVITDEPCDWVRKTQESFHPVEVTEGLWIVPEWCSPPDPKATNIVLNPGLAFGTGDHPTTKLCLLLLHEIIKGGESFLDYGTGSGILAIAALKFGAALSVGTDIDPEAITCARHNASLNNIGPEKMHLFLVPSESTSLQDETASGETKEHNRNSMTVAAETETFDIVVANILLNPLLELVDQIAASAKPGAVVAVTGILSEQLPRLEDCYSRYLEGISVSELDGWVCVQGRRKRSTEKV